MDKNIREHIAYEKGFNKGWQKSEYANKWIRIEDEAPEQKRLLLYFFEGTGGASIGFYFGIDEYYCPETGHVFGGGGFLTGDVTHWMYVPEYPEGYEYLMEGHAEYFRELAKDINEIKKPIGGDEGDDEFFSREDDAREV
mgnify:CR=1 FL=1